MSEFSEPAYVRLFGMDAWLQENDGRLPSLLPNLPHPLGMMGDPAELYWNDLYSVANTQSYGDPKHKKMTDDAFYLYVNRITGGREAMYDIRARPAPDDWLQAEAKKVLLSLTDAMHED